MTRANCAVAMLGTIRFASRFTIARSSLRSFPLTLTLVGKGTHLFLREYEAAIAELRKQAVVAPKDPRAPFFLSAALELTGNHGEATSMVELYLKVKSDDTIWRTLELSHEPAFIAAASATRKALHDAGLDEPSSRP